MNTSSEASLKGHKSNKKTGVSLNQNQQEKNESSSHQSGLRHSISNSRDGYAKYDVIAIIHKVVLNPICNIIQTDRGEILKIPQETGAEKRRENEVNLMKAARKIRKVLG